MAHRLRNLPQIDKLINNPLFSAYNKELLLRLARELVDEIRSDILSTQNSENQQHKLSKTETTDKQQKAHSKTTKSSQESISITALEHDKIVQELKIRYDSLLSPSLMPLINATGIIVHTNLGRSVISHEIIYEITPLLTSYNNLEYDLERGERGERYAHVSKLLCAILDCEDVLVVNNNAAAVFLILNTFAQGREVIVSRGELIEIGGSFRLPEVMKNSGAILKEVGATNKTHKRDYIEAVSENSAMMMKAHRSNYDIVGFSSEVKLGEMIVLARERNLIDYYDLGSGFLDKIDFSCEPTLKEISHLKPSLVSFSGDKLLGSAQAGIIFGKGTLIKQLKKNQLLRMLRVDKVTLALLEATLRAYISNRHEAIPTIHMAKLDIETLKTRAENLAKNLSKNYEARIAQTTGFAGGGALPNRGFSSISLALKHKNLSPILLERALRKNLIIARIEGDEIMLDLRTIFKGELDELLRRLNEI